MRATEFPEANSQLLAPEGMEDRVYDLQVWKGNEELPLVISCWKPTWKDRWRIAIGRPLWFHAEGLTHPPVTIETDYPFRSQDRPKKEWTVKRVIQWLFSLIGLWIIISLILIRLSQ